MSTVYATPDKPFSWSRAIFAGLIATIVITISLALFGTNLMKSLGSMLMPSASVGVQYAVGGVVHLMIGLFYGVVYAALFGRVSEWNPVLKGAVFGLAITAIALAAMPILASMLGGGKAANPCNPCAAKAANPCNPCAPKAAAENPCNPCAPKATTNPCNPCAAKATGGQNACSTRGNPCNPCGGDQGPYNGAVSAINHLLYGIALALVYRTRPAA